MPNDDWEEPSSVQVTYITCTVVQPGAYVAFLRGFCKHLICPVHLSKLDLGRVGADLHPLIPQALTLTSRKAQPLAYNDVLFPCAPYRPWLLHLSLRSRPSTCPPAPTTILASSPPSHSHFALNLLNPSNRRPISTAIRTPQPILPSINILPVQTRISIP